MVSTTFLSTLLAAATQAKASPNRPAQPQKHSTGTIQCPIILTGQVKASLTPSDFDTAATSPFDPAFVRGSEPWSEILQFPSIPNSRFDNATYKSVEVIIDDDSVFQGQTGFRRAGLLMDGDANEGGPGSVGVRTLHFSVRQDRGRELNLTHEYLNVWHETADYSANQFNFEMGAIIGGSSEKNTFKVLDRRNTEVWSTAIVETAWQNFAVTLDFERNTLQIYYSANNDPLKAVTDALPNDNSGEGQYQIGILKKPTGTDDVVYSGYQESNIDEGQIYGGLFVEDGAGGCISL